MLNLIIYNSTQDIYQLNFLDKNYYFHHLNVITPDPESADTIRDRLATYSDRKNIEVITMANFITSSLEKISGSTLEQYKSKRDLFVLLGNVWKTLHGGNSFDQFLYAYDIFSELRSFTTQYDLIEDILDEFDPDLKNDILAMWQFLDKINVLDEHKAYLKMSDYFLKQTLTLSEKKQLFFFWNFNFLSSTQIDLLKIISEKNDIFIPIHTDVYKNVTSNDWPYWLMTGEITLNEIILSETTIIGPSLPKKVVTYPKGKMVPTIQKYLQESEISHHFDIFQAGTSLSYNNILELPTLSIPFKIGINLYEDIISKIIYQIKNKFLINKKTKVHIGLIGKFIENKLKKYFISTPSLKRDIRLLKIFSEIISITQNWVELSKQNSDLQEFDLDLFKHLLILDTPRTFLTPIINYNFEKNTFGHIKSLLGDIPQTPTLVCINSHQKLSFSGIIRSEKVISKLAVIGPIQRRDFSIVQFKSKVFPILTHKDTAIFIESGLLDSNILWDDIISSLDINSQAYHNLETKINAKKRFSFLSKSPPLKLETSKSISSSKLQDYIDCPRKYYINYLINMTPSPISKKDLQNFQLGIIEHDILKEYFDLYHEFNEQNHYKLCEQIFDKYISEHDLHLTQFNFTKHFNEIHFFTSHTIKYLADLKRIYKFNFLFENEFENKSDGDKLIRGRVDLLMYNDDGHALIDFKRSPSSVPEVSSFKNFEKVQMWFYINHSNPPQNMLLFWGFLCIKSLKQSKLFSYNQEFKETYDKSPELSHCNLSYYKDFGLSYENYQNFEKSKIESLLVDKKYPIQPINDKVCQFCHIKKICPKSEEGKV